MSRCEQFEISPESIEQELRPIVCEQRQADLRRSVVYIYINGSCVDCECPWVVDGVWVSVHVQAGGDVQGYIYIYMVVVLTVSVHGL